MSLPLRELCCPGRRLVALRTRLVLEPLEDRSLPSGIGGTLQEFPAGSRPAGIVTGPDGALWYTSDLDGIRRMTTDGSFSTIVPLNDAFPGQIVVGPDGALWFNETSDGKIGRVTTDGKLEEFATPDLQGIRGIAVGSDGALWFTVVSDMFHPDKIDRITTDGTITEFPLPGDDPLTPASPSRITAGPDGALWFTESAGRIGRITTDGSFTEFPLPPTPPGGMDGFNPWLPSDITLGADGNLWFTEVSGYIGRITTDGTVSEFQVPGGGDPSNLVAGPGGDLWFTECFGDRIGQITLNGDISTVSIGPQGPGKELGQLTIGPDGNLWFTENFANQIGQLTLGGDNSPTGINIESTSGMPFSGVLATFSPPASAPAPLEAQIDWGDGQVSAGTVQPASGGTMAVTGTHTYVVWGNFQIRVTFTSGSTAVDTVVSTASVPAAPPNVRFLERVYEVLLGRGLDPLGAKAWRSQLDQGVSREVVVQQIEGSTEYRTDLIENLYTSLLGRKAEPQGLTAWLYVLGAGASSDQLRAGILASDEYYRRHGGQPDGFLAAIYHDTLGRAPDPFGMTAFTADLRVVTRQQVAAAILDSPEYHQDRIQALYHTLLHRDPDAAGLTSWTSLLRQGIPDEDLLARMLASKEFFAST
jgi:virginiamycin B lyase